MHTCIYDDVKTMGKRASEIGAEAIREALADRGEANVIVATGASQFSMLECLVAAKGIDWSRVSMFHLDEYVGMPVTHPASFRKYLKERVADKLPGLRKFEYVNGDARPLEGEIARLNASIRQKPIDVAFIGIGENGHLAFNDPPADFDTESPYIVVNLDEKCRLQQVGEGWFSGLSEVPAQAISMSIKQILKSKLIVCTVPDERKSLAVEMALAAPVSPSAPCSILRTHPNCYLVVDAPAAGRVLKRAK